MKNNLLLTLTTCCLLALTSISPAVAQEQKQRTLTVTGQGVETIPTTITQVQLGVEIQGKNAIEVQQEVAKRTSAIIDFLRSRNVEQLQTTGIQLQPVYDYTEQQRRLIGYIGINTVSFRLKTDQIGSLLDEAVQVGATRIDSVSFTATDEAIAVARKEALREATLDAQQQADAVLNALNFTPREVVGIQINNASLPIPKSFSVEQRTPADVSTPVIGGEQTVEASVTLQISY